MKKNDIHQSSLRLFNLFGFEVRLDCSWIFLATLITWSLAESSFPANFPNLPTHIYWLMGIISAAGLFLSLIFHEFCHSLVGRYYGMSFTGITLFIFGGIAEMSNDPPNPKTEFFMSIAGPIFSLILGMMFYLAQQVGFDNHWPTPINGVLSYLSTINIVVGIFNLLPGFPLDGGRVLRSILWWWKGDLTWATQIACQGGIGLGFAMIFLGIFLIILGVFSSGLWMLLLGFFLQHLAKMSYHHLDTHDDK